MSTLNLKITHKPIKAYYAELERLDQLNITNETSVREPFQTLIKQCVRQLNWTLVTEYPMKGHQENQIFVDGSLLNDSNVPYGYWEAKDIHDDLAAEVKRKLAQGYPSDNILFQTPHRAILLQNNQQVADVDLTDPTKLVQVLQTFFEYRPPEIAKWERGDSAIQGRSTCVWEGLGENHQKRTRNEP